MLHFTENHIFFFQMFWKNSLSKKMHWNIIFLVLSGKRVFFFRKIWYFSFGRKMKDNFSQEIHGNMIFSVYMHKCYKYDIILLQKNQVWSSPEKIYLKVVDILDSILEEVPTILCTFIETFIGIFIYCFPVKTETGNLI